MLSRQRILGATLSSHPRCTRLHIRGSFNYLIDIDFVSIQVTYNYFVGPIMHTPCGWTLSIRRSSEGIVLYIFA